MFRAERSAVLTVRLSLTVSKDRSVALVHFDYPQGESSI
jgi:hypothetical protein